MKSSRDLAPQASSAATHGHQSEKWPDTVWLNQTSRCSLGSLMLAEHTSLDNLPFVHYTCFMLVQSAQAKFKS